MIRVVSKFNAVPGFGLSLRLAALISNEVGGGAGFWKGKNEDIKDPMDRNTTVSNVESANSPNQQSIRS
jgi:hypothetical protein